LYGLIGTLGRTQTGAAELAPFSTGHSGIRVFHRELTHLYSPIQNELNGFQPPARSRVMRRIWAISTEASALAMDFSQTFAKRAASARGQLEAEDGRFAEVLSILRKEQMRR